jgi:hypothetical protein
MEKLTADEYRQMAARNIQDREDSFDRCDTDGFLSQWASGISSNLNQTLAELADAGWVSSFPGLFNAKTGERVPAKIIQVRDRYRGFGKSFRSVWAIVDPKTDKFTGIFLPVGENSRKQKQLGFVEKQEMAPAYAKITGSGYGLSGSAWVIVYRTDGGYPREMRQNMTRDEVVEYILQNKSEKLQLYSTLNKVSGSGKEFVRLSFKNGSCDLSLDVYGPKFILGKCQIDAYGRPVFNSVDDALDYINRINPEANR